jgi:hypothetical protein
VSDPGLTYVARFTEGEILESTFSLGLEFSCGWAADDRTWLGGSSGRVFSESDDQIPSEFGVASLAGLAANSVAEVVSLDFANRKVRVVLDALTGVAPDRLRFEMIVDAIPVPDGCWLVCAVAPSVDQNTFRANEFFARSPMRADHDTYALLLLRRDLVSDIRFVEHCEYIGSIRQQNDAVYCYFLGNERLKDRPQPARPVLIVEQLPAGKSEWQRNVSSVGVDAPYFYGSQLLFDRRVGFYGYAASGPRDGTVKHLLRSEDGVNWQSALRF